MKVALVQTAIADYRDRFVEGIISEFGSELKIYVGERYFEESTATSKFVLSADCTSVVDNIFFLKRKIGFQKLPFVQLLFKDVIVFELNPRLLSNWPLMLCRRLIGKKNVGWGHAWARKGMNSRSEFVRHLMRKLNNNLVFYTKTQETEFLGKYPGFSGRTFVAPNSLYAGNSIYPAVGDSRDFVYVGRMVSGKKPGLLIEAFAQYCKSENQACLHMVGNGPELDFLKEQARKLRIDDRVIFYGHLSDESELRKIYGKSLASVSPGYVGLSITQSFAFGRPMIVSKFENHSPEIEALIDGVNGCFFETDQIASLANTMLEFYEKRDIWRSKFESVAEDCRSRYSIERMVKGFSDAIRN